MYNVLPELYQKVLSKILDSIDSKGYYSGSHEFEYEGVECTMILSAVIHYRKERFPEGESEFVADMVPVWWEFHSYVDGEEVLNNFSFNELREYI